MAAPEYVPVDPVDAPRVYGSPPRLTEPWPASRAGELVERGQPTGPLLGTQGPDLGYALKLARSLTDQLVLADGEHLDDVIAGCTAVAMKRSSAFGRAPVIHDLIAAFGIWGYLGEAPEELVERRRPLFAEVATPHHWVDRRRIVDLVPVEVLRRPHTELRDAAGRWAELLAFDDAA